MEFNVVGYRVTEAAHNPAHLIALTVHNCPSLTYGQVCKVKDILANILGLDKHVFWLYSSESGSAVLGWGFGRGLAGGVHDKLSTPLSLSLSLSLSPQGGSMKSETVFSALASDSRPCTSEPLPASYLRNDAAVPPSQPPLPMEEPHKTGAKRKHPTGAAEHDVVLGGCAGIRNPQNLPPPTKRMTVEHFPHEGLRLCPTEFSRQYVTENFEPAGSVGESNHIRALRENQPLIVDNLNLMSILPHLNGNSLLTEAENQEMLLIGLTESEKIMRLVAIIGRKGEDGFHRFLAALEAAEDHPTHKTIAEALESSLIYLLGDCAGIRSPQNLPPPTKRMTVEHFPHEGLYLDGLSPTEFSRQYVTEDFEEPAGSVGESNHIRALRENQPLIVDNLNLMSILPHLNVNSLLTEAENQEMLLIGLTESEKIMRLVTIIGRKGEDGFHRFLAALEAAADHPTHKTIAEALERSLQNPPRPGTLGSSSPTLLQCFVSNLKGWYKNKHFYQGTSGPFIYDIKFIRLALLTKKGVSEAERSKDKFLRATLHGHVEDIVKKKKRLEMEGIFRYGKDPRKLVLVEGAPGVGKTMLAMKLCQLWAQGRALQEYDIVFFVELRQYQKETTLKLETLLETHLEGDQEMMKEVMQHLVRTGGDKVLLILEGWDELSPALRDPFSWFFELIKAKKLPNASIMVTSRPSVTAPLYDYMDERRIEVLGFDKNQQNEYIQKNIEDPAVPQRVRDHLKRFPNLRALAHIPLTLSIICSVAMKSTSLPITLTELYDKYVCTFLFHNLQKSSSDSLRSLIGLDSLDTIPKEVRQVFEGLCKLALSGFEKKAFIFERCDLEEHCLPCSGEKFDGFGLLTTRTQSATAGRKPLYQFRHLSIQEFLAGLQINSIGDMDRTRLLKEYRSDRQFQNIWKFLSGVSKLRDEAFCQQLVLPTRKGGRDQLFLLHCLYEAQNPDICHRAAGKMEHMLHLDNTTLNATDCLCAAYVMGKSEGKWQVNLRGCNIGGDGLEVFKWQLKIHDSQNLKIIRLDLTHNQLDASAMRHVAEMFLELKAKIINVEIASNKIGDEGARLLSKALKEDSSRVKQLHFRDCGFTSGAAKWFSEVLQSSKTLSALHFGFDKLGDRGAEYISAALCQNTVLEELGLYTAGLTGAGLSFLANALKTNRTLSVIRMDRNNFTAPDCHIIAEILLTDNSVERIDLSRNPIGDDGFSIILDALIKKPDALKKLGIFGCEITSREMHKFVEFFKKTTAFTGMNIGLNRLGDTGAGHIVQALRENKSESVKEIYMADTGLSDMGKQLVTEAGAMRKDLIVSCEVNEFLKIGKARIQEKLWSQ
ncbi:NACHT, LRR and PYD domains-containing protein 12 [Geodia barretti]|uniref:NACHT, LRR and PYD domains-containing protein 12 n=1 Tax=Geodia barretti TaxID=519541 RepID=A0AA35XA25_GEOBA|nr:NACHT, LRR and PYD domains-containing protein 12 [Geodia barretti]